MSPSGTRRPPDPRGRATARRPEARAPSSATTRSGTSRSRRDPPNGVPVARGRRPPGRARGVARRGLPAAGEARPRPAPRRLRPRRRMPTTTDSSSVRASAKNGTKFRALYDDGDFYRLPLAVRGRPRALHDARVLDPPRRRAHRPAVPPLEPCSARSGTRAPGTGRPTASGPSGPRSSGPRPTAPRSSSPASAATCPLHQILPAGRRGAGRAVRRVGLRPRRRPLAASSGPSSPATTGIERSAAPRIVRLPDSILQERLDEAACWICEKKNRQGDVVRLEQWCPRPIVEAVRDRRTWPGRAPAARRRDRADDAARRLDPRPPGLRRETGADLRAGAGATRRCPSAPPTPRSPRPTGRSSSRSASSRSPTPADEAAVAALMLQIACRYAIAGPVPMTAVIAPEFGSGKTLLARGRDQRHDRARPRRDAARGRAPVPTARRRCGSA